MDTIQRRLNELGVGNNPVHVEEEKVIIKYRLLNNGEIIEQDDEYYIIEAKGWMSTGIGWKECIGKKYKEGLDTFLFRRKINLDIGRAKKAIRLLDGLCDKYGYWSTLKDEKFQDEVLSVIKKWSWPGRRKPRRKKESGNKECRLLGNGPFTGMIGEIFNYFSYENGVQGVKVKVLSDNIEIKVPYSEIEIL